MNVSMGRRTSTVCAALLARVLSAGISMALVSVPCHAMTCGGGSITPVAAPYTLLAIAGQPLTVDALAMFSSTCSGGAVEYRFSQGGAVVRDWSPNPGLVTTTAVSLRYTVEARCSNGPGCVVGSLATIVAHSSLGSATLARQEDGHLLISGIGTSGVDGMRMNLGTIPGLVNGLETQFAEPNFGATSETGARGVYTVQANVPGGTLCRVTVEDVGPGTLEVRPEIPAAGPTLYTVTVLDGSTVTGTFANLSSATIQTGDCQEVEFD